MNNKEIGQKIAGHRSKLNLTQTALAEKLCVSPKTVSKWESGNGLPSIEFWPELSKIFGITIDELLCKDIQEIKPKSALEEMNVVALFRMLSPNYLNFPDQVKNILKEEWLTYILKEEDLTLSDFYNFVNSKSKPKSIKECIERLFNMDTVSNSGIQRRLKVGYPRAVKIREKLISENMVDSDNYEWIDKSDDKLSNILIGEFKDILESENEDELDINEIEIDKINVINDNLTNNEKREALKLLEECSVDENHPCDSVLCFFQRENIVNVLIMSDYCLNLDVYKVKSFNDLTAKIKKPIADHTFIILEANAETDITQAAALCDLNMDFEIAIKINNELKDEFRLSIFYVKYKE